jgi:glutathione S-transferase
MSPTLLGGNVSPFVRKVRVFCAEKGIDYDLEPINPFAAPEGFRELSPLGKIPVLRDGDHHIPDSSVICAYLEKKHPDAPLYPAAPLDFARALWLEEYMDGAVVPAAGPKVFLPLVLAPLMQGKEPDETEPLRFAKEELPVFYDYLEKQLGDDDFFVGGQLSIADIAVASPFVNLRHAGVAPDRKAFPKLRAFLDRMHGRPSFKACIEEESPVFGKRAALIQD